MATFCLFLYWFVLFETSIESHMLKWRKVYENSDDDNNNNDNNNNNSNNGHESSVTDSNESTLRT